MVDIKVMKNDDTCNQYIEDFIESELEQGIAFASGKNNRTLLKDHPNSDALRNYSSMAWIFYRGAWIFDFMSELTRLLW